jgi:hypothetical protein
MSREIKFRVWAATDDGMKMVYLDEAVCDNGLWFSSNTHIDDYAEDVMQFTGLLDKNGKEIYAGDLCKDFDGQVYEIIHHPGYFSFGGGVMGCGELEQSQIEIIIIGNIYENR